MSDIFKVVGNKRVVVAWSESEGEKERLEKKVKEEIGRNKVIKMRQKALETEIKKKGTAIKKITEKCWTETNMAADSDLNFVSNAKAKVFHYNR